MTRYCKHCHREYWVGEPDCPFCEFERRDKMIYRGAMMVIIAVLGAWVLYLKQPF